MRLRRTIRLIIVLLALFALSLTVPKQYKSWFGSGSEYTKVIYSEILNDFIITHYNGVMDDVMAKKKSKKKKRNKENTINQDRKGRHYTDRQLEKLSPLNNASQLAYDGDFPDSICGIRVTPESVAAEEFSVYYGDHSEPYYGLGELKDQLGYASSKLNSDDMFRVEATGIKFLDCTTNTIDTTKSRLFDVAFQKAGFVYPCPRMWTPSDKSDMEALGYFLNDNRGDLYQMTMCEGMPTVRKRNRPDDKQVRNINFIDRNDMLAFVITEDGNTYLMGRDYSYQRIALPNARNQRIAMQANLLNRMFSYQYDNRSVYFVTDTLYNVVDTCTVWQPDYTKTTAATIQQILFPLAVSQSAWNGFAFRWSNPLYFIFLNSMLVVAMAFYRRRYTDMGLHKSDAVDLLLIAVFGLLGLLSVLAVPRVTTNKQKTNTPCKN